jgi:CBS domain-containing protein
MLRLSMPVSTFMTAPAIAVSETALLADADQVLRDRNVSCVAVVGEDGRPVGAISRTDLLRIGRVEARLRSRPALISFPDRQVRDAMIRGLVAVTPETALSAAARTMASCRIHRVFVMTGDELAGVLSTKDVLLAIDAARVITPIREVMSAPVHTIPLSAKLSLAVDRLEQAHVSGLCVVDDDGWPVGTFTQREALASRDLAGDTRVEEVMSYSMLCLPTLTPLHRAAAHAYATRARRVLAIEDRYVRGVLTGLDFARFAAVC